MKVPKTPPSHKTSTPEGAAKNSEKQKSSFQGNVEGPRKVWKEENSLLNQWDLLGKTSHKITGHQVELLKKNDKKSKENQVAKHVSKAIKELFPKPTK